MSPRLDVIDRAIADWRQKLDLVTANLIALESLEVHRRLIGPERDSVLRFEGASRKRVPAAIETVADLFGQLAALTHVVQSAIALRRSLSRLWPSEAAMARIE